MKSSPTIIVLVALIFIGVTYWQWHAPSVSSSTATTTAATSREAKDSAIVSPPPQPIIATPDAAPVKVAQAASTAPIDREAEDKIEINLILNDLMTVVRTGGFGDALERFCDPEPLAKMQPAMLQKNQADLRRPRSDETIQVWLDVLQDFQKQTPVFSENGTRAVFEIHDPTNNGRPPILQTFYLTKAANGKWYLTPTLIRAGALGYGFVEHPYKD